MRRLVSKPELLTRWVTLGTLIVLIAASAAYMKVKAQESELSPVPNKEDKWAQYRFLLGDWVADNGGKPELGTGDFSFKLDLNDNIMVRKNHAEYPATKDKPASKHDDLMIMYFTGRGPIRATYWDNEGHVINYSAALLPNMKTLQFLSDVTQDAPRFRLTYVPQDDGSLKISFDIAPPGSAEMFKTYLTGTAKKK